MTESTDAAAIQEIDRTPVEFGDEATVQAAQERASTDEGAVRSNIFPGINLQTGERETDQVAIENTKIATGGERPADATEVVSVQGKVEHQTGPAGVGGTAAPAGATGATTAPGGSAPPTF